MFFESFLGDLVAVVVTLAIVTTAYVRWKYQYWYRKNLPYLEPSFPFGNNVNPFKAKQTTGRNVKRQYDEMKARGWKHGGVYNILTPIYLAVDLDYVKNILTKDFQYFTDRGVYVNDKDDPLNSHLFKMSGQKWRNMRMKLTPTFTSGKMKMMFHTLSLCVPNFLEKIETDCLEGMPIDIKERFGCLTTDIIGTCAFGLDCNSSKDEDSEFRVYGRKLVNITKFRKLVSLFCTNFPNAGRFLGLSFTPKDVTDFFLKVVNDTMSYREKNNYVRKDFLQMLIDLKNENQNGGGLTMTELAAQCFVFFVAGFETSSTTMTFVMYQLTKNLDVQEKLREEIKTVLAKHDGKITYEAIQEMKYMDQVINEALRMYPPVPVLLRQCTKDYKVPDSDVVIEKGNIVFIPVLGIHYDEDYYPEPKKFDPERFSEENKTKRHHYSHLPFGEGPRNCIGLRFGLMQSKVGLTYLLKNFKFTLDKKTKEPLKMKVYSFIPSVEGEVWLKGEKI